MESQQDVPDLDTASAAIATPAAESVASAVVEKEPQVRKHRVRWNRGVLGLGRVLLLFVAGVCFLLGILGVLLPGLPATPFLLLTSYFLIRSSPRLNAALLRSRFFGPILRDWQIHGGVRKDVKVKAVVMVALSVVATSILLRFSLLSIAGVFTFAAIGIVVILRLPSPKRHAE